MFVRLATAVSAASLLVSAASPAAATAIPAGSTYVALGSSYASGPGVTQEAPDSPARCAQSMDNYARQIARAMKLKLVDRSCSGATAVNILQMGQFGLPAQIEGVTPDTRLVTVTIGGNDVRYMADIGLAACKHNGGTCAPPPAGFDVDQAFKTMEANYRTVAAEVHRRAPQARLVIVDYVTLFPAGPPCPGLDLTAAEEAELQARFDHLARVTAQVAKDTGADLIKATDITRDHNACAADPWVNGFVQRSPGWGPAAFHPRLAAHTAIAKAVEQRLEGKQ